MAKNEKTSKKVATDASKLLKDKESSKKVKEVSASDLSQAPDKPKTKAKPKVVKKK